MSTHLPTCVKDVEIILLALPAFACDHVFQELVPYLRKGQLIVNLAGYFSAIFEQQILLNSASEQDIIFAELTSFPYACRADNSGSVNIVAIKDFVGIATTQKEKVNEVITQLSDVIPCPLHAKSSILEVGLYNTSGIGHSPAILFNAARIGNKDEFYFYKEGISVETANVMMRLDKERISIGNELGYKIPQHYEVLNEYYGYKFTSILDYFKNSPIHNSIKFFPNSTKTRYVLEDVPYILVPWYSLAEHLGVQANGIKTLIDAMSLLHDIDYMEKGRKFNSLLIEQYK
jgi:opine dehydrogenase